MILNKEQIEDVFPMSDIQKGMVFHSLKERGVYHDQMMNIVRFGDLDDQILERALQLMQDKHETLRTCFFLDFNEKQIQVVYKPEAIAVDYQHHDLSDKTREEQRFFIKEDLNEDRARSFEFEKPGLWRYRTYALGDGQVAACFIFHHAIIDGWSDASFNTELYNIYQELLRNEDYVPEKLKSSYKDFIVEHHLFNQKSGIKEFWQQELHGYNRYSFSEKEDFTAFTCISHVFPKEIYEATSKYAVANHLSVRAVCCAAFLYCLQLYSKDRDLTIGIITNNRPAKEDGEKILGCFLNTIPFRIQVQKEMSWDSWLTTVNSKLNFLKKYEKTSLFRISEFIGEVAGDKNPITDVIFSYVDFHVYHQIGKPQVNHTASAEKSQPVNDAEIRNAGEIRENSSFAFTVNATGGVISFSISYLTSFISHRMANDFRKNFQVILQEIITSSSRVIDREQLLSRDQFLKLTEEFNDTISPDSEKATEVSDVLELFDKSARLSLNGIALEANEDQWTYETFTRKINQAANLLVSSGVRKGHIVAVVTDRSLNFMAYTYAILKVGATYLPIDRSYPTKRILDCLTDSNTQFLIHDGELGQQKAYAGIKTIDLSQDINAYADVFDKVPVSKEDLAYIIYTSGSTGKPKGVKIRHGSFLNYILWAGQEYIGSSNCVMALHTSISFDLTVTSIFLPLCFGGNLHVYSEASNDQIAHVLMKNDELTTLKLTPSHLKILCDSPDIAQNIKCLIVGGEEFDSRLADRALEKFGEEVRIINEYGPTEATVGCVFHEYITGSITRSTVQIGKPIHNCQIYIVDAHVELLPIGVIGEILIGGDVLAAGYMNNSDLTNKKFIESPWQKGALLYRTGDLGSWDSDGNLSFHGRLDDQVKVRGFLIELGDIEVQLASHDQIREVLVLAREIKGDKYLVGYYVSESELADADLRSFLSRKLPDYMLPHYFIHLDRFPLTPNGKVDRRALPYPDVEMSAYVAPRNAMEEKLEEIWSDVLKRDRAEIGIRRSFFDLGGHSLKAMILVNRILKELEVSVPLREIFTYQHIEGLAAYLTGLESTGYAPIARAEEQEQYELSSAQRRMYFLHKLSPESLAYNMPQLVRLTGDIALSQLSDAFQRLVMRHQILRTSFVQGNSDVYQQIEKDPDFSVSFQSVSEDEVEESIRDFMRPFDLSQGPLLRVSVLTLPEGDHLLMLDMHHIITDGVSQKILLREFMRLYQGETLGEMSLEYVDYSAWQNSPSEQSRITEHKRYWHEVFSGELTQLELPYDRARPLMRDHSGATVGARLNAEERLILEKLTEESDGTMFMTLLSIFQVLLSKLSNQEDIIVGTPVAGRVHPDLDEMIGLFVNTIALRGNVKGDMLFMELLEQVRSHTLAAFEHQSYQYEDLIDGLNLPRDTSRNPLFDVLFTLQQYESQSQQLPSMAMQPYPTGHQVSKFDLTFTAVESPDQLSVYFQYSTALFDQATIERFLAYFRKLITHLGTDHSVRLSELDILSEEERQTQLDVFNSTAKVYPNTSTLTSLFAARVEEAGDKVAILHNEAQMTYSELSRRSDLVASQLWSVGVRPGGVVGLLMDRSIDQIVGILGILKVGGAYLPLDVSHPKDRLSGMLGTSGATHLLTDGKGPDLSDVIADAVIDIKALDSGSEKPSDWTLNEDHRLLAYIIFTSGSSGKPKGVKVSHQSVVNYITHQQDFFELGEDERVLQFSRMTFDASVEQIWLSLLSGSTLVLVDQSVISDQQAFVSYLESSSVTHLHATPSYLASLDLPGGMPLRRVVAGGEVCSSFVAARIAEHYDFYNKYGPTEATISVAEHKLRKEDLRMRSIPIGKPIRNTRLYVVGRNDELLPVGVYGELLIGGDGLAQGYLEESTHEVLLQDDPFKPDEQVYRTGDIVRWRGDGSLEYGGRLDDQVKLRGYRIELEEVAEVMRGHGSVEESTVSLQEFGGERYMTGYYVSATGLSSEALKDYLTSQLPSYMVPYYVVPLASMPLTTHGKVDKRALPRPEIGGESAYVAPSDELEEQLASIWSEVLGLEAEQISTQANFFEIGGHSLMAATLTNRISRHFEMDMPLISIFTAPQISSLAPVVRKELYKKEKTDESLRIMKKARSTEELFLLLKRAEESDETLFFIHDGSGDIQGYTAFLEELQHFNCWGIRFPGLYDVDTGDVDISKLAADYIDIIKGIQPQGPYNLLGWSYGGVICYEMMRQLEAEGIKEGKLIMIDSTLNSHPEKNNSRMINVPSLQMFKTVTSQILPARSSKIRRLKSFSALLDFLMKYDDSEGELLSAFMGKFPDVWKYMVPHSDKLTLRETFMRYKSIYALQKAKSTFQAKQKLEAMTVYLHASKSKIDTDILWELFDEHLLTFEFHGDHSSILLKPTVRQLTTTVEEALLRRNDELIPLENE